MWKPYSASMIFFPLSIYKTCSLVSLFQKHNGDHERFFSQILLFYRPKIWEHFGWRIVFLLVYIIVIFLIFIKNPNFKYHKLWGKKILNPQQEGALNQSNKISKILEIFPTIIQSVNNIIGNNGIFHFVWFFNLFFERGHVTCVKWWALWCF